MGGLALPTGCIIGFIVPALMVSEEGAKDHNQGISEFNTYILTQNIIVTLLCLPLVMIGKSKPPTPPSYFINLVTFIDIPQVSPMKSCSLKKIGRN